MAYSILIVDDDRTFVEELKSALQWNRLRITEVYTAFSVREAIAFLSKDEADFVLCDIEAGWQRSSAAQVDSGKPRVDGMHCPFELRGIFLCPECVAVRRL